MLGPDARPDMARSSARMESHRPDGGIDLLFAALYGLLSSRIRHARILAIG